MENIFFDDWQSLFRILVVGIAAYLSLILLLRISGNRTLSKMNSFDFIVTIALGSTFSSAILQKSVTISAAVLAFGLLIGMQYILTWLSVRSAKVEAFLKSEPCLVFSSGRYLEGAMRKARVTKSEIDSAIRSQGFESSQLVTAVILESSGRFSAIGSVLRPGTLN